MGRQSKDAEKLSPQAWGQLTINIFFLLGRTGWLTGVEWMLRGFKRGYGWVITRRFSLHVEGNVPRDVVDRCSFCY